MCRIYANLYIFIYTFSCQTIYNHQYTAANMFENGPTNNDNSLPLLTPTSPPLSEQDAEFAEYMKLFDDIEQELNNVDGAVAAIPAQPHDQARVELLCNVVSTQHNLINQLFSLCINMNNIYSKGIKQ